MYYKRVLLWEGHAIISSSGNTCIPSPPPPAALMMILAKESLQYLGFILFSMNYTISSMIHTKKYESYFFLV
jgi:hypothetical protein